MLQYFTTEALQAAAGKENVSKPPLRRTSVPKGASWCIYLIPLFVFDTQVQSEQCSFCLLLVKTLENLLPKERTEVNHTAPTGEAPIGSYKDDSRFCVSSPGRCDRPAGGGLQYSALVLPQPVPGSGEQVQQEGAGCYPELRHPAGHLHPPPDVQRARGAPVRSGE